eukprot:gnl/TRDRNA2_/TRDRNA2_197511_c0_seq1.p1 gnl/TRDRNA2_/TRDRNA2_197511_c0~~gnl/TRDRNA2_/TRDRNA2_197511_c0_seq1.p1  ORF type:complete len:424 (-),score=63.57 gnl/TRDRNA2_/TRDRNA2_197511_c0_seq1:78-1349(-)
MSEPSTALNESLLRKQHLCHAHCGGKVLALLSLCVGLGLAALLSLSACSGWQHVYIHDPAVTMAWRYMHAGRAGHQHFMQPGKVPQVKQPVSREKSARARQFMSLVRASTETSIENAAETAASVMPKNATLFGELWQQYKENATLVKGNAEPGKILCDKAMVAYRQGMYNDAYPLLNAAFEKTQPESLLAGIIMLSTGVVYAADEQYQEAIELFNELFEEHPLMSVRKQAASLRSKVLLQRLKEANEKENSGTQNAKWLYGEGVYAYSRGGYQDAYTYLRKALNKTDWFTQLGGDIQIYMALSLDACGERDEAIALYELLEEKHPSSKTRKEASRLVYILKAPAMKISEDEKLKMPVLDNLDTNSKKYSGRRPRRARPPSKKSVQDRYQDGDFEIKVYLPNKYVLVASACIAVYVAWYSTTIS